MSTSPTGENLFAPLRGQQAISGQVWRRSALGSKPVYLSACVRSEDLNLGRLGFPGIPSSPVSHLSALVLGSWLSPGVQGQPSSYMAEHGVPVRFLQARGVVQVTLAPCANRSGKSVRSRLQPFCRASSCFLRCPVITLILPDLTLDTDLLALLGRGSCSIFRSDLAQCA